MECSKEIVWIEVTPIIVSSGEEVVAYWASDQLDADVEIDDPVGIEKSCVYGGEEGSEDIYLFGAYEDKIISGYLDEDSPYSLYVDGEMVQSGGSEQLFLAHFDESMESTDGDVPTDYSIEYLDGKFDGGLGGWVEYDSSGNFDLEEGTMEMWLTQRMDDTGDHVFFEYTDSQNLMELKFKPGIDGFQFKHKDYSGEPEEVDAFNLNIYELDYNVPYHVVLSWSTERNFSYFYINGQKKISGAYDITGAGSGGKIKVGHRSVSIVDEFRIYSRMLKESEVEYIYMRNRPLQNNEIYYSGEISNGDEIKLESAGDNFLIGYASPKKISSLSPEFHVVANTDSLDVSFETPSPMVGCRYDYSPKDYLDLVYSANQISDTSYSFDMPVGSLVDSVNFYIKCEDICKDDYSFYRRVRVLPEFDNNQPKLLNQFWNGHIEEEHVEYLAKYDVLSISPGNLRYVERLRQIRELNPNIVIYVYDTLWDVSGKETETNYFIWNKHYMMEDEWRLKDKDGNYVYNLYFLRSDNYNINVYAYPEVHEQMAQFGVDAYLSRGYFDGMFYDNIKHSFWWLYDRDSPDCDYGQPGSNCFPQPLDMNVDGINEDLDIQSDFDMDEEIFKIGLRRVMGLVDEKLGSDTLVMLNNAVEFHSISNGKEWEEKLRESSFIYHTADPENPDCFPYWQEHAREPKINMNMVRISDWEDWEHARYGLATSLMFDMYTYFTISDDRRNTFWMDEYAVDLQTGIPERTLEAKGYLGEPLGPMERVDTDGEVLMRKFENEIVIVSNSVSYYDVNLGKSYRLIDGVQDPGKNTGALVEQVRLYRTDGRVLLLPLCDGGDGPNGDGDCI